MSREKQIKEMAKILCTDYDMGKCMVDSFDCLEGHCSKRERIEALYNAGYRKSSEVAEEVINNALSKIQIMISAIKAQEESGIITEFNGGAKTALELVIKDIAELKKKYTEN